jgi:hypothetical protein
VRFLSKPNKKHPHVLKTCSMCTRERSLKANFYSSASPLFRNDGKVPYCKDCLRAMIDIDDLESVHEVLQKIDKPFLADIWKKAIESEKETFGEYMRMVCSLHQYKNLTYKNSSTKEKTEATMQTEEQKELDGIDEIETEHGNIAVTKELKSKWGNYSNREILEMEKLYQEMIFSNSIETPQHRKQLYFYCKLSVLMDRSLTEGDYAGYEKLSRQFSELQKSSGFRPIDRKSSDEANGIKSFSQIFAEVEANGYVEPLNVDLIENQDIVDRTIQYILNYTRKVLGVEKLAEPPKDTPKIERVEK